METLEDPVREGPPPRRGVRSLDRRTIGICVAIAVVVALISAVVTAALVGGDDRPEASLARASAVPTASFTRFDGSKGSLADYAGQPIVVNFFASTCAPCRREMPALEQVQRNVGDKVTIVGLAVQDTKEAATGLIERTKVTYDTALDPGGFVFNGAGGTVLPFTIFVDGDGTIVERHTGAMTRDQIRRKISGDLLAGG